ncbi:hypothetical protein KII98_02900 [Leuconostoc gelidum subsp. gasicomitatum]|uniref:hypothetical protein n=1 Tax=Leuconostoc gasicomitatum TaxID=115778 RepID=UPI001CC75278|nr:hypothetical protein [Leuconostoc gasicomitatum]MBZ5952896.1 hypothetical protein [Leuconostoc gasicomitatum]
MSYTFEQAENSFKKSCTYGKQKKKTFSSEQIQVANVIIDQLRQKYAPVINMTPAEYYLIKDYKDNTSVGFAGFYNYVTSQKTAMKFGLVSVEKYAQFSEEELMKAWLNIKSIEVVEEEEQ